MIATRGPAFTAWESTRDARRHDACGAGGRRRQLRLAAGRRREVRGHPPRRHPAGRRRRALGPVVPGARGRNRHRTVAIVRVTSPWLAGLRGSALFAGMALGAVERDEVRARWCPPTSRSGPSRGTGRRTTPSARGSCRSGTPPSGCSSAAAGALATLGGELRDLGLDGGSSFPKSGSLSWATENVSTSRFATQCAPATGSPLLMRTTAIAVPAASRFMASAEVSAARRLRCRGRRTRRSRLAVGCHGLLAGDTAAHCCRAVSMERCRPGDRPAKVSWRTWWRPGRTRRTRPRPSRPRRPWPG